MDGVITQPRSMTIGSRSRLAIAVNCNGIRNGWQTGERRDGVHTGS